MITSSDNLQVAKSSGAAKKLVEEQLGCSSHKWDPFETIDFGSSSEEEVENKEAANFEIIHLDERSSDCDIFEVEHTSDVCANRESNAVAWLNTVGKSVKMPVPVCKKDKMLKIQQWQDWLTLEQQVGAISLEI